MLFTELMRLNCTEAFKVVALSPSISLLKSCLHLINDVSEFAKHPTYAYYISQDKECLRLCNT